jgi:branched-subunit amino acid ABC-type transport system permease component
MFEPIQDMLLRWKANSSERAKLQHTYAILALGLILLAGIIGLMNYAVGQQILAAAILAAGVFLINAVVWSILQSAVLLRLGSRKPIAKKK